MIMRCVFCAELGVATTATTTTNDAFPFLCLQLGVSPPSSTQGSPTFGGNNASLPRPLCRGCHGLWEEVSVLYTNMQGLVNLLARRVQQFKKNMHKGHDDDKEGKAGGCTARKRTAPPPPPPSHDGESIISWWYPSSDSGKKKKMAEESPVDVSSGIVVDHVIGGHNEEEIKSELEDNVVVVELGEVGDGFVADADGIEGDQEMVLEMEEIEILPDDKDYGGDDAEVMDPSYTPTATPTATSSSQSRVRRNGKGKVEPDPEFQEDALKTIENLGERITQLEKAVHNSLKPTSAPHVTLWSWPLKTEEELTTVEAWLQDGQNFRQEVSVLSRIGGTSDSKVIYNTLHLMIAEELALSIRYTNTSGKIPFGNRLSAQLVRDSYRFGNPGSKITEKKLNETIAAWFRQSIERDKSRNKNKRNVANSSQDATKIVTETISRRNLPNQNASSPRRGSASSVSNYDSQ